MEYKDFAKSNLGKRVRFQDNSHWNEQKGMIVGYFIDYKSSMDDLLILVSFIDENEGWNEKRLDENDIVLLHSPLNRSFGYISMKSIVEFIN